MWRFPSFLHFVFAYRWNQDSWNREWDDLWGIHRASCGEYICCQWLQTVSVCLWCSSVRVMVCRAQLCIPYNLRPCDHVWLYFLEFLPHCSVGTRPTTAALWLTRPPFTPSCHGCCWCVVLQLSIFSQSHFFDQLTLMFWRVSICRVGTGRMPTDYSVTGV